jgi:hypothetical protein
MPDLRLYRATLLLGLLAAVVLMFSVVSRPDPLHTDIAADAFEGTTAAALAEQLVKAAPDRRPGSPDDAAAAALVEHRFRQIESGQVSEERFAGPYQGSDVTMENVTLVLPGSSNRRIVVAAPRDCAGGTCAVSSAAATAVLLEIAKAFDGSRHRKTLVFVSLDGSAAGAAGARVLGRSLRSAPADGVIVISQPASVRQERPFVVPWSSGAQNTSIQLIESAADTVSSQLGASDPLRLGTFDSLLRLAVPAGLGDQAPLIDEGSAAVALSSAGDLPLPESADGPAQVSTTTLQDFGRAALSLVFILDGHAKAPDHGPQAYIPLGGKLIPGWALALLAIALLLPVGIVSIDALARSARQGEQVGRALAWVASRAIPFAGALLLAYLLAAVGLIPSPVFPFDPARLDAGATAVLALLAMLGTAVAAAFGMRRLGLTGPPGEVPGPAVGLMVFVSVLATWLANPYLALLLVPTAHLWLFAGFLRGRRVLAPAAVLAGLIVPFAILVHLAGELGIGMALPWDLLMMFTGRHFGPLAAVAVCLLGAALLGLLAIIWKRPPPPPDIARRGVRTRGPLTYAGPGSLGGTESALPWK